MSEKGGSRKVRKSENPEDSHESNPDSYRDESPKSEEENNSVFNFPQSETANAILNTDEKKQQR